VKVESSRVRYNPRGARTGLHRAAFASSTHTLPQMCARTTW